MGMDWMEKNGACAEFFKRFVGDIARAHIDLSGASWMK